MLGLDDTRLDNKKVSCIGKDCIRESRDEYTHNRPLQITGKVGVYIEVSSFLKTHKTCNYIEFTDLIPDRVSYP